ncbi:MAG: hypothetical protein ACLUE2_21145 [Bacteroides cellulosilyticus]
MKRVQTMATITLPTHRVRTTVHSKTMTTLYIINALVGYDEGGSNVSLGWYQTVAFIWNVNYPW